MVQADLNSFGIQVVRVTGGAIENQRATTIFVGQSTLTNNAFHIAMDIDRGNVNRTDIAFVGEENWGSASDTAMALADVVLHEAGHTFGLHHVSSGAALESMGLRYSAPQSSWLANTAFLNQTFNAYHAGDPQQNSYQVMAATFGTVSSPALAAPNALGLPASIAWQGTTYRTQLDCGFDHVHNLVGGLDHHDEDDHDDDHDSLAENPALTAAINGLSVRSVSPVANTRSQGSLSGSNGTPAAINLFDLVHQLQFEETEHRRSTTAKSPASFSVADLDDVLGSWESDTYGLN